MDMVEQQELLACRSPLQGDPAGIGIAPVGPDSTGAAGFKLMILQREQGREGCGIEGADAKRHRLSPN